MGVIGKKLCERHNRCWYCGVEMRGKRAGQSHPFRRTRDHLIPTSRGGHDKPYNVVPSCRRCNTEKGNLYLDEYRALKGGSEHRFYGERA